jgi:UDP-2,3-diacylglucosamine hydrolase
VKYGLIAGNGRFPILALETAQALGHDVVVIGLKEEAPPEIEALASKCFWISIGQLSKLIEICKSEGVSEVIMCGQVKHTKIFSAIQPDWRLFKLLAALDTKNTDALIGGVAKVLADEGIQLGDSTKLLKPLLAGEGVLTKRKPTREEERDLQYGRSVANALVAVEAMEGTDAMLQRAHELTGGKPLRLAKVSRRRQHLQFDVPVAGPGTVAAMRATNTTALCIDAGRTLLLDRQQMLQRANDNDIAIIGVAPESD